MKIYSFFIRLLVILSVILVINWKCEDPENGVANNPQHYKAITVQVLSQETDEADVSKGSGIVIDKKSGLILTAKHGIYSLPKSNSFSNQNIFEHISIVDHNNKKKIAYPIYLSKYLDFAILKIENYDNSFSQEVSFDNSDSEVLDNIVYTGFPGGIYGNYSGKIADVKDNYYSLDMEVVGGMSGGPIFNTKGYCKGIVLFKKNKGIGGDALKSKAITNLLNENRENLKKSKKFRLKLESMQSDFSSEVSFHVRITVNGKSQDFKKIKLLNSNFEENITSTTIYPTDKIEIDIWKDNYLLDELILDWSFEDYPQKSYEKLHSGSVIQSEKNVILRYSLI